MAKEEHQHKAPPFSFPDLSLLVSYADALYYVQRRLSLFGRGDLKPFCEARQFTYTYVVGLKNGTLKREGPRLVQRLLHSLDVPTALVRFPLDSPSESFLLPDAGALATFESQIAYFKSCE